MGLRDDREVHGHVPLRIRFALSFGTNTKRGAMSDSTKKDDKKLVLRDEDMETNRVGRRSSLAILGTAVAGAALVAGAPATAEASCTDRDPSDPSGRGRGTGVTDRDPNDSPGCGRGQRVSGYTDRDPSDPRGNGRGPRNCSDSDPNDPVGAGRRC